jgi:hypothetical protein
LLHSIRAKKRPEPSEQFVSLKAEEVKTFISHSSRDKWIARKLSEEITELGCETFLDEKDIETGETIDEEIHSHLHDCDDFLLLLSPDSIKSHWVLIELGGALALRKRIVIILLYLSPNDIPPPISKYLARDINDIDRYYGEVRKKIDGLLESPPPKPKSKAKQKAVTTFRVGERVKIISEPQSHASHWLGWSSQRGMDDYCGKEVTIEAVSDDFVMIKEDGGKFGWAFEWLTPVG